MNYNIYLIVGINFIFLSFTKKIISNKMTYFLINSDKVIANQVSRNAYEWIILFNDFLKAVDFSEYWSYEGSTTQPPCEEGIKWTIINDI